MYLNWETLPFSPVSLFSYALLFHVFSLLKPIVSFLPASVNDFPHTDYPLVPKSYGACLQNIIYLEYMYYVSVPPLSFSHHVFWTTDKSPTSLMTLLHRVDNMIFQKCELALVSSIHVSPISSSLL